MKSYPDLVAMVGLPRSGKTTIVNKEYKGYAIVCPDLVRISIHGQRFIKSAEPYVWATVYAMVDALVLAGCNVVIDATNTTEERRKPWIERGFRFHVVETTKEECIKRAESEKDLEIVPIINKMADQFEWAGLA